MNWLDLAIGLLLVLAVWQGWRQGAVNQLVGIAALAVGVYLAWRFGRVVGGWFGDAAWTGVAGFAAVFIVVIISMIVLGRVTRGIFKVTGLGIFDNILGVLLSVLKMFAMVGLVISIFEFLDPEGKIISAEIRGDSMLLTAIETVNGVIFPFVRSMLNSL